MNNFHIRKNFCDGPVPANCNGGPLGAPTVQSRMCSIGRRYWCVNVHAERSSTLFLGPDWVTSSWAKVGTGCIAIGRFGGLSLNLGMPEHIGRIQGGG